jgi:cell division septation protein DedD
VSEYTAFISAMRAGRKMRERMFDTIEQRHAHDLRNGEDGKRFYEDLLSAVRDCGDTQAAQEFECRFLPLLNADNPSRNAEIGPHDEITKQDRAGSQRHGGWGWVSAAGVAAIALGALLLLGFNGSMKTADRSNITESSVSAAHATVSSDTMNAAAPGPSADAPIHADDATELASPETMTSPAQAPATEQELNPAH